MPVPTETHPFRDLRRVSRSECGLCTEVARWFLFEAQWLNATGGIRTICA